MRHWMGTALPSAGVGVAFTCALTEKLAAQSPNASPFDPSSVTEDYEIGVRASALGARTIFARVKGADGAIIASRGLFPATIAASVTQKARWTLGIALAGWDRLAHIPSPPKRSSISMVAGYWMRWRDHRSLIAAVFILAGYSALVIAVLRIAWTSGGSPFVETAAPNLKWLLSVTFALLVWRMALRTWFTTATYGWHEAWRAPFRMFISNIIAIMANSRALLRYIGLWRGGVLFWDKTAHDYPADERSRLAASTKRMAH